MGKMCFSDFQTIRVLILRILRLKLYTKSHVDTQDNPIEFTVHIHYTYIIYMFIV